MKKGRIGRGRGFGLAGRMDRIGEVYQGGIGGVWGWHVGCVLRCAMPIDFLPGSPERFGAAWARGVSRRRFLEGLGWIGSVGATGVGALAVSGSATGGGRVVRGRGVALLSDTHIDGDLGATAMGTNMASNLRAVLVDVLRMQGIGRVIVNGDCAYKVGLGTDYEAFTKLLQPVRDAGVPVHVTLGNHDDRDQFRRVVREGLVEGRVVMEKEFAAIGGGAVDWIVMDSCTKPVSEGRFGAGQLRWLRERLDANPTRPVVIVGHHNPREPSSKYPLEDTEEFFAIIAPRRQVKAYVFGHTHRWQITQHESGLHLVNLPPTAYVFVAGRPNGWVHAQASETGMDLQLRCVDGRHPQHGERVSLRWRT